MRKLPQFLTSGSNFLSFLTGQQFIIHQRAYRLYRYYLNLSFTAASKLRGKTSRHTHIQAPPSPPPWHPSLAPALGNVSGALILIPLHVPSSVRAWMEIPTDAEPRRGGDWMESCHLDCVSKYLRQTSNEPPSLLISPVSAPHALPHPSALLHG